MEIKFWACPLHRVLRVGLNLPREVAQQSFFCYHRLRSVSKKRQCRPCPSQHWRGVRRTGWFRPSQHWRGVRRTGCFRPSQHWRGVRRTGWFRPSQHWRGVRRTGGFAPPNIGGVSEERGGFAALRIPHAFSFLNRLNLPFPSPKLNHSFFYRNAFTTLKMLHGTRFLTV